jgi:hypothetical protein
LALFGCAAIAATPLSEATALSEAAAQSEIGTVSKIRTLRLLPEKIQRQIEGMWLTLQASDPEVKAGAPMNAQFDAQPA